MGKIKTKIDHEKIRERNVLIISLFIAVIMIFSIVGFALMSGGPSGSSSGSMDFPLQAGAFRDDIGNTYWGAVKNSEQFVFYSVDGFDERQDIGLLAQRMKNYNLIEVFVDSNFTDSNALYMIENKISNAIDINFVRVNDGSCDMENKLIVSNNVSYEDGNCMKFIVSNENASIEADMLAYHMLK